MSFRWMVAGQRMDISDLCLQAVSKYIGIESMGMKDSHHGAIPSGSKVQMAYRLSARPWGFRQLY